MQKSTLLIGTLMLSFAAGLAYTRPIPQDDDPTPLGEAMGSLQSGQRKLRKLLKDTEGKEATIEVIREMESGALAAIALPPAAPADMEAAQQPGWRIDFQRQVVQVLDALLVMELAVAEGRADDAQAAYKALGALKKTGHDKYQE